MNNWIWCGCQCGLSDSSNKKKTTYFPAPIPLSSLDRQLDKSGAHSKQSKLNCLRYFIRAKKLRHSENQSSNWKTFYINCIHLFLGARTLGHKCIRLLSSVVIQQHVRCAIGVGEQPQECKTRRASEERADSHTTQTGDTNYRIH